MGHSSWSNDNPRRIIVVVGTIYSGLFFYDPTPGAGNLVGSWTVQAGTDPYGNAFPPGLLIGNPSTGTPTLLLTQGNSGQKPQIEFGSGIATEATPASITCAVDGAGAAAQSDVTLRSAQETAFPDSTSIDLIGSSHNGTGPVQMLLNYITTTGSFKTYAQLTAAGFQILAGSVTGVTPGTGTGRATPATPESWHTLGLSAGFSGGVAGTATPRYQLEGIGGGRTRLSGGVSLTAGQAQGTIIGTLPAGYRPLNDLYINTANNLSGGATNVESLHIDTGGNIRLGVAGSNGNYVMLDNITFPLD